jgi:two-component system LytT family response regulator
MKSKIRTIVVDDEPLILEGMVSDLQTYCTSVDVVATALHIKEALEKIRLYKPELLILDIQLHGQTAFDLLDAINDSSLYIILVTAYENYGIQAARHGVNNYLLKPVSVGELTRAIKLIEDKRAYQPKLQHENEKDYLTISYREFVLFVRFEDIVVIEAKGNACLITTIDGKEHMASRLLKEMESFLPQESFIRVHQSYIIHSIYINKYIRTKYGDLLMNNGQFVPISSSRRQEVIERLGL